MTTTTNFALTLPIVGADADAWGGELNTDLTTIDAVLGRCQNLIINGDFRVNQRGYASSGTLAAGAYGHDRWKGGASGGNYSFTQLAAPTTVTIAANKSMIQVIEDKNVIGGGYILSWTGSATARATINSATPSGNFAVSPIYVTGQTAGTTMSLEFTGANAAGGSAIATNTGTLGTIKLETGVTPTPPSPFVPDNYSVSLLRCLPYCYQTQPDGSSTAQRLGLGYAISTTQCEILVAMPVPMRTGSPTLTPISNTGVTDGVTLTALIALSLSANTGGSREMCILATTGGGLTQFRPYSLVSSASATAALRFETEL